MKKQLCISVLVCLLLSFLSFSAETLSYQSPDIKIRGIVTAVQYDYQGYFLGGQFRLTALISVRLNETLMKPERFTRETDQLVAVSYNYSSPSGCKVGDIVEVYGLWIPILDVPCSMTIQVDDNVAGSYVELVPLPPSPPSPTEDHVQEVASIDVQGEYSNGSLYYPDDQHVMGLWYDWINTQGTQVIFLAYHSEVYNSPIITFVGQCYTARDGTEVFIGNTLSLMEAYKDANENNVPETGEISYFFIVNSSIGFTITPIQKILLGEVVHYNWGVRYQNIDGFLTDENGTMKAKMIVEHMAFSYDYHIQGNVSYIKTNFDIGEIVSMESYEPDLPLQGLSLSLVYATMTITPKNYTVLVNEQPYNSTTASPSPVTANRTEVRIQNQKAFEFVFGEDYTLYRGSISEAYKSFSAASAANTVPSNARVSLVWLVEQLEDVLRELFLKISKMQANIDLDYMASTFVYRICYPTWEGCRIKHDPTYVAYLTTTEGLLSPPAPQLIIMIAIAVIGSVALAVALFDLRRTRRLMKSGSPLNMNAGP